MNLTLTETTISLYEYVCKRGDVQGYYIRGYDPKKESETKVPENLEIGETYNECVASSDSLISLFEKTKEYMDVETDLHLDTSVFSAMVSNSSWSWMKYELIAIKIKI